MSGKTCRCGRPMYRASVMCWSCNAERRRNTAATAAAIEQRFWSKVDRRGPAECWIWTGALSTGYGSFSWAGDARPSHRYAWELAHGPIPDDLTVDHLCFERRCQNVAHMELVTRAENTRRMLPRITRVPRYGVDNHAARLTESDVRVIRSMHAEGATNVALASEFGVSPQAIGAVVRRENWRQVA